MRDAVVVQDVSVAYDRNEVIRDLSLSVRCGEFYVIAGPNGSGKSTLLKTVAGLLRPSRGSVALFGRPLASYGRRRLSHTVAYLPQTIPLDFPFTVAEVVLMGRSPHLGPFRLEGRSDIQKAQEAMERTHVAHLARRPIDRLSGGERQRVFLAQALCQEPRLLLLDEPTAALDLAHQLRLMDLLEELRCDREITIVMVSHDINLAAMYGDTILLLKDGRSVCQGPPAQVLTFQSLEAAYGCVVLVDESPLGPFPRVTPVPSRYLEAAARESGGQGAGEADGEGAGQGAPGS
ncbi:iron complex transport system ATP-binding protein [Desulfacinum hydrothermale DSM 13146]|uniref:Iron complex transport system ATP-binding protein n=1 Tax=Desulfacinum hydrothermale DSM 13146 TaxID=1121390 RepID=A0A1W1XXY2_9BACT|nr:ABC transporter ATP-binding protein [Desulfacinum hydrothermale]SMC28735.1 iron complex transport system ATP-binding protein [Desulfacinum hydrothermale DSM 13146]